MSNLYKNYKNVINVGPSDIIGTSKVNRSKFPKDIGFIMFYSPGCPHCVDAVDGWVSLANKLKGVVDIGAFNCIETDAHNTKSTELGIRAIPTIKIVKNGMLGNYDSGVSKNNVINFLCDMNDELCKFKDSNSMSGGGGGDDLRVENMQLRAQVRDLQETVQKLKAIIKDQDERLQEFYDMY